MKKIVLFPVVLSIACGCVDSPKNGVPCSVPYERGVTNKDFPVIAEGFAGVTCEHDARVSADRKVLSIDSSKAGHEFA